MAATGEAMALLNKEAHVILGPPPYSHGQLHYKRASQDPSSGPRPEAPPHVYMVTPQGRFLFPRSAQRPTFFIAEYGPQPCMAMPQQCSVPAGPPVTDVMDAPPPRSMATPPPQIPAYPATLADLIPTNKQGVDTKEVEEEAAATLETPLPPSSTSNGEAQVESEKLTVSLHAPHHLEDPLEKEELPPQPDPPAHTETTVQAAVSRPQKKNRKWKRKSLNQMEAVGDLLDAFKEEQIVVQPESEPEPEPAPAPEPELQPLAASPLAQEEAELPWKDEEDQLDAENIQPDSPQPTTPDMENQSKEEQWEPIIKEKKKYEREFLLTFQFVPASLIKPLGLPDISDVILNKANKSPKCKPEINRGPDFAPESANLGSPGMGGGSRGPTQRMEPRKMISLSVNDHVQLNKAEKAWKPSAIKPVWSSQPEELGEKDSEQTKDLLKQFCSTLNKLTPQNFEKLMAKVQILTIDTEERLKGVIDLTFEKAIFEPAFSEVYAKMCRFLIGLKVQTKENPGCQADFLKLLLNRCQKEFEKDNDSHEIFEKKQKEVDAASVEEEKQRLREELEDAKDKARRRSLGNIKFIGELFKLKMLAEVVMHDCIMKLLKNHDNETLEVLCKLLSTIGKDLDVKKEKHCVDQCFHQMEEMVKERKTSSRIRFMMQDVLDLRTNNWVPRRGNQGPKTIDQIREQAKMEEQMEGQEAFNIKKETDGGQWQLANRGR